MEVSTLYTVYKKEDFILNPVFIGVYDSENKANIAILENIEDRVKNEELNCSVELAKYDYQVHIVTLNSPTMHMVDE
ncbi:hypothetical protein [Staphylococcus saprophyticus]|uniref:hypothetical protein n=1 Tax=Staphylococcus saprophyticus TaxID=29385 RepID=UPI0034C687E0